jgi:hypothetical protein
MINDLDFVDSTSRSYVNYEIPDKLFKLWVLLLKDFHRTDNSLYLLLFKKL